MPRRGDNIYKRKDNRWEGRYPCGYTAEGKTRYHSVYGKTYAEVREKMLQMQQKRQHTSQNIKMTVKALFDEWLLSISSRTKESTIANYKMKIRKHLLPDFGGMKYEMLNTDAPEDDTDAPEDDTDTPEDDVDTPEDDTDTPEDDMDTPEDDAGLCYYADICNGPLK